MVNKGVIAAGLAAAGYVGYRQYYGGSDGGDNSSNVGGGSAAGRAPKQVGAAPAAGGGTNVTVEAPERSGSPFDGVPSPFNKDEPVDTGGGDTSDKKTVRTTDAETVADSTVGSTAPEATAESINKRSQEKDMSVDPVIRDDTGTPTGTRAPDSSDAKDTSQKKTQRDEPSGGFSGGLSPAPSGDLFSAAPDNEPDMSTPPEPETEDDGGDDGFLFF